MDIPAFTLNNSPYYLATVLVLLIIFLILKNPIKNIIKSIKSKHKRKKENKKQIKEKTKKQKKQKTKKKVYIQNWKLTLFTVTAMTIILSKIIPAKNILTNEFEGLYNFIFSYILHNNATTIIMAIALSAIFVLIITLFETISTKQNKYIKITYTTIMSAITSAIILLLLAAIEQTKMSKINTIIFGVSFFIIAILTNFKDFSQENKIQKISEIKEETKNQNPKNI